MAANQPEKIDIDAFINEGIALLKKNLEYYPAFDQAKPYNEKNEYFIELAWRGEQKLFSRNLYWAAELYFEQLLNVIRDYEQRYNKRFNKGMVYANLGIAQMVISKFDVGIANLLAAGEADQPINPGYDVLNTHLWAQFEDYKIFDYLINLNTCPDAGLSFRVNKTFLSDLVMSLEQQDRIFFEGTIWVLRDNLHLHQIAPNVYTDGRLYSGLKDLCLLTESLLRKKLITKSSPITLGSGLLTKALSKQKIGYPQNNLMTKANDIQEFLKNLEYILDNAGSAELRRVYCLHLVRNFTGHHFDLSKAATSPKGKTFFDMYETVLINILSAILYFKHINAI